MLKCFPVNFLLFKGHWKYHIRLFQLPPQPAHRIRLPSHEPSGARVEGRGRVAGYEVASHSLEGAAGSDGASTEEAESEIVGGSQLTVSSDKSRN